MGGTVVVTAGQYQDAGGPISGSFRFVPAPGGIAVKTIASDFDCAAGPTEIIVPDGTYILWMSTAAFVIAVPVIVDSTAGAVQDIVQLLGTSTTPQAAFGPGGLLAPYVPPVSGSGSAAVPAAGLAGQE